MRPNIWLRICPELAPRAQALVKAGWKAVGVHRMFGDEIVQLEAPRA